MTNPVISPETDLVLTRVVDVPPALVWKAWTEPQHLPHWFCPKPYGARVVKMDVRPAGAFHCVILAPDGSDMADSPGCYLEVVENQRLSFTSALVEGFRPAPPLPAANAEGPPSFHFTAIITLEPVAAGATRYTATVLHNCEADRKVHEAMGFYEGWGTALDQLVAYAKTHLS